MSNSMNKTGLWIALYNSALSGLCANSSLNEMGPADIATDAADLADAATKVVLERFELLELLHKAKVAPPG